ncbi:N-acetylmuramoyl-L-alanine amidase [Niameybacter massiliensis]|uniref:N-acetylmuramoyl-L-alanine amidase n=1 Tax=Holtiella tumoricola TaxID=3018743 RepID=A0AA42DL78_9FIRM|nr:N-acetylmuramoyl-L-alanine amidase [Holtiella tumoricola]MDA3731019.1 N-acetylmuramoyl-L-alanine amidase [Holtiella tumoricola]
MRKKSSFIYIGLILMGVMGLLNIEVKNPNQVYAQKPTMKKLIVIDPGHGGRDVGAIVDEALEKHINLQIAHKVKYKLSQQGYDVVMTREQDEEVSLEQRVKLSNESNAQLFVSIHQNAIEDNVTHGIETWFESGKSASKQFAQFIQEQTSLATGAKNRGIKDYTSLYVTRNTHAPSVLVECGFITSDYERSLLSSDRYQEEIAEGIVEGINLYFQSEPI